MLLTNPEGLARQADGQGVQEPRALALAARRLDQEVGRAARRANQAGEGTGSTLRFGTTCESSGRVEAREEQPSHSESGHAVMAAGEACRVTVRLATR